MRTVVIDAPMPVVREAIEGLREARAAHGLDGKVWVQSPDLDQTEASELELIVNAMEFAGLPVEVLEDQDPFPPGVGEGE